ncbi:MAG TPA: hypothetical protein VH333_21955 [Pseudonocardiaceae bacterium]|jgi:hypothetical protein|nr:hypothetical protein [Pseudonocardiaceae bacterium]
MTSHRVGVDLRQGEYIISVYSRTPKGVWVGDGVPTRLAEDLPFEQLGDEVRKALARSRQVGVPELTRDSRPDKPLLDLLGLPDYATYAKGTRSVRVRIDGGEIVQVTPLRNGGPQRGFTSISDAKQTFVYESPEQLGAAVKEAFTKAV